MNLFIKSLLDADVRLADVLLCGEISNFSGHYRSGHLYFTLKDELAAVKAVMFSRSAAKLRFSPQNGMKVIVRGRASVYERDGVYQIYADDMQPDGAGALAVAYEQLKNRLEKEGLFAPEHKKPIPKFPQRIGVVTSPTGAAVQDILNIISRRWPLATVVLCPVSVQGDLAAGEAAAAICELDEKKACDVIVFGRGGGSIEDLWAFNDENLVRTVYNCSIPTISAIGHETDFTLCDFAADLRAPTPSAAAELATPDILQQKHILAGLQDALYGNISDLVAAQRLRYDALVRIRSFSSPQHFFDNEKYRTDRLTERLHNAYRRRLTVLDANLRTNAAKLDSLSPLKVLSRGYAAVYTGAHIVSGVKELHKGDSVCISMADGNVNCTVDSIENK